MPEYTDVDCNKIAAEVISNEIQLIKKSIGARATSVLERASDWLPKCYSEYLISPLARVGRTRTLLSGHEAIPISDFYVPLDVKFIGGQQIKATIEDFLGGARHVLLVGGGGSGKSILLRNLFIQSVNMKHGIPIYYELRNIQNESESNIQLIESIAKHIGTEKHASKPDAMIRLITHGKVLLLLDGLDELPSNLQREVCLQIESIARSSPNTRMVVSSRPSESLGIAPHFGVAATCDVTLDKAISIISRLKYNYEIASKFIKELKGGLFDRNSGLLSTPLMLIIMLLTYQDSAGVPSKQHLFYENAIDALMRRHDATKTGYKRELRCGLAADDFSYLLSAFAYATYFEEMFQFSMDQFRHSLSIATRLTSINVNPDEFHKDLLESVCLFTKEGLAYTFVHRSFQEYFAASFIMRSDSDEQKMLMDGIMHRAGRDSVLRMVADMNPSLVERTYILPWIKQVRSATKSQSSSIERLHAFWDMVPVRLSRMAFSIHDTDKPRSDSVIDQVQVEYMLEADLTGR